MLKFNEFIYSIVRRWKPLVTIALIAAVLTSGIYLVCTKSAKTPSLEGTDKAEWLSTDEYYVAKHKFVALGNSVTPYESVLAAYSSNFWGNGPKEYINETVFGGEEDIKYISQLVKVDNLAISNCVIVECMYYNEETCSKMSEALMKYIDSLKVDFTERLGSHTLAIVDKSLEPGYGESNTERFEAVKNYIKGQGIEYVENGGFSAKRMFVYAFLIAFVCVFVAIIAILLKDSLKNVIYNADGLIENKKLDLLGDFSFMKLKNGVDKWLYKIFINNSNLSEKGVCALIAYRLSSYHNDAFVLTGNNEEELNSLKALLLSANDKLNISSKKLPDCDADGISEWEKEHKVIYVAHRFKDDKKAIKSFIKVYSNAGLDFEGVIFI